MRAGLFPIAFAVSTSGCSPAPKTKAPYVVAADEKDAQSQIRRLQEQWELSSHASKKEMRDELELFVRRHRDDPSAQEARLMLAQVALLERRFGSAVALLEPLLSGKRGRIRDEAHLVMASVEIRMGQVEQGLKRLAPLEGKLLSRSAEETFYRERISAALSARRWRLAIDSMSAWLKKQGESSGASTRKWIEEALIAVPASALFRIVRPAGQTLVAQPEHEDERWLQRLMIERIAHEALAQEDPRLARDLIQSAPPWLKAGDRGDSLVRLASLAQNAAHITGRTLGVVLGGDSELSRSRNLRVAAGVLRAISESQAQGRPVDYVAAEDHGSTAGALSSLSGQGATFVLGGVDESSARAALLFAKARAVPTVVLMRPRLLPPASAYGFVSGVSEREEVEALMQAYPYAPDPLVVGGSELPCQEASQDKMSAALAAQGGVVFVLGDARCLHLLTHTGYAYRERLKWGVGLSNAAGPFPPGWTFRVLTTGSFPRGRTESGPLSAAQLDPNWDWFFALGYDSARLVIQALFELPEVAVSQKEKVRALHQEAAEALVRVRTELLTTGARGFNEQLRLERTFSTRELSPE